MKITPKQYAILLYELTKDEPKKEIEERTRDFLNLLFKQRALNKLPKILMFYSQYYNAREGVIDVEVTTARTAQKSVFSEIGKQLGKNVKVEIKSREDPALIGGARIRAGDYMIDDTLRARLRALRSTL
ncbi:F0F1 ATP synthase subunit delta [Candidatus Uhrbacteria bacterium]|nr:F0F1 ATP synthase subunit delta [Candidatus Uhrbacteria bacterium]